MSQSKQVASRKQEQMTLDLPGLSKVVAKFDGGAVCSDGGLLLLRKADACLGLAELASYAISDERRPEYVQHTVVDMLRQRIYGIAAGYEDCNDAGQLRVDAMHKLALGRDLVGGLALASQPSLSRFENNIDATSNAALQKLLVHLFVKQSRKAPKVLRLAMDTTCDETYGSQQMTFYNGYYRAFCYAPLFIFTECGFPLCALLRPGNPNPIDDAKRMLKKVLHELRLSWPQTRIELTADAAFASSEMFDFLEAEGVTYFIAAAGHAGYTYHAEKTVFQCKKEFDEFGHPSPEVKRHSLAVNQQERKANWRMIEEKKRFASKAEGRVQELFEEHYGVKKFIEFQYRAREWSRDRRIICRAQVDQKGPDTRFVVTNATRMTARKIYQDKYCSRAQCENWIKDLKVYLKSGRTSCQEFEANQFRLMLHTFAYILMYFIKKRAQLREMTLETFRRQLLKIGVLVEQKCREVRLHLASEFAWRDQFQVAWANT